MTNNPFVLKSYVADYPDGKAEQPTSESFINLYNLPSASSVQ